MGWGRMNRSWAVYLRTFIVQLGWVLRKPWEFLLFPLETLTLQLEKHNPNGEVLETVTMAAVCLLGAQAQQADQIRRLGHLSCVLRALGHKDNAVLKSCIQLIHALSHNARSELHTCTHKGARFFLVGKDGGLCSCIDYHGLNVIKVKNRYLLPLMSSASESLQGSQVFTKLDSRNTYHLVYIQERDKWKTTFNTIEGIVNTLQYHSGSPTPQPSSRIESITPP